MTTRSLQGLIAVTAGVSLCAASFGQLVFDGAVMDSSGRLERAGVSSLRLQAGGTGGGEITLIDPRGAARTRPLGESIALVPAAWTSEGSPAGGARMDAWALAGAPFVELVDGQRFVGRPGRIGAEGETIAWVHERFGTLMLPIDEVARFVMRPGEERVSPAAAPKSDTLWLVNGDRIDGFLETIGPRTGGEGFALTMSVGDVRAPGKSGANRVTVPVDQVVRAQFANARRAMKGPVVWLADGSVVALGAAVTDAQKSALLLTASAAKAPAQAERGAAESPGATAMALFPAQDISAIVFDSTRVSGLAGLEIVAHRPIGLARRPGPRVDAFDAMPAALGAADVLIPGPMEVEWAMPAGASRLVGTARLDEPDWTWGECVVVVEVVSGTASREVSRASLGGSAVQAPLSAEIGATRLGDRLRIRVEPGELGPIRDRVRLERVVLLR